MKNKNLILGLVFLCLLVIVGFAGYFVGLRSSGSKFSDASYRQSSGDARDNSAQGSIVIEELKAAVSKNPKDAALLLRLADAYFEATRFNEAVDNYKKALEITPDDAYIYNSIGLSVHYLGNSAEGVKYVDMALKKDPMQQRIWLTKGFILAYGLGDLDAAKGAWEKAAALNPDSQVGKAASDYLEKIRSGASALPAR